MNLEAIHEFLGWCVLLNGTFFVLALLKFWAIRKHAVRWHERVFRLDETSLQRLYWNYLIVLKAGFVLFNLTPYLALFLVA